MEFESYTEKARGFLQAAQTAALASNHQHFMPEHLLKVFLDDSKGSVSKLIVAAGGDPGVARNEVNAALARIPKVEGPGATQIFLSPETAKLFENAKKI